jgi:hypothetical protein
MLALLGCKIQKQPMRKVYTTDDLIRFIYRETSENEERGIVEQLTSDESFLQEYRTMVKTVTAIGRKADGTSPYQPEYNYGILGIAQRKNGTLSSAQRRRFVWCFSIQQILSTFVNEP